MKLATLLSLSTVLVLGGWAQGVPPEPNQHQPQDPQHAHVHAGAFDGCAIECDPSNPEHRRKYGLDEHLAPGLRETFPVTTVVDNGPGANRVDIVFVGDGYTAAEMGEYADDVDYVLVEFFIVEPFDAYEPYLNIHRVEVVSNESGVDEPDQGIYVDTALDMSYGMTTRHLTVSIGKATDAAENAPDWDQILAMANHSRWGGTGYYFQEIGTFPGKNTASYQVAIHEFGHSFGNLADEYVEYYGETYPFGEPWEANVSTWDAVQQAAQELKWYRWLDHPDVDTFEGARYYSYGIYRPTLTSRMRSSSQPFGPVNVEQLVRLIYETVSPIDDATPPSADPMLAGCLVRTQP